MDWKNVETFFTDNILNVTTSKEDYEKGLKWLKKLSLTQDGKRLATCIVIDIKCKAIKVEIYSSLISSIKDVYLDPMHAFDEACRSFSVYPRSNYGQKNEATVDDLYVRVMTGSTFFKQYQLIEPDGGLYRDYFDLKKHKLPNIENKINLSLSKWVNRSKNIAWIQPIKEFKEILADNNDESLATIVADKFGLPIEFTNEEDYTLLCLSFDKKYFKEQCFQPTAFEGSWKYFGGFYISHYKEDEWGRTCSISGNCSCSKERIYQEFNINEIPISIKEIGFAKKISENRNNLLNEAFSRFNRA